MAERDGNDGAERQPAESGGHGMGAGNRVQRRVGEHEVKVDMTGQNTTGETTQFGQAIYIIGEHQQVIENYGLICRDCKDGEIHRSIEALAGTPCVDRSAPHAEDTTALQAGYAAARQMHEANPEVHHGSGPGPGTTGGCSCTPSNGPDCMNCR